jgi:Uncharacterized protein conserved in bacteria
MTEDNLGRHKDSEWHSFWQNLKDGYDVFERTRRPPKVSVCNDKYHFYEQDPAEIRGAGPLDVCTETAAAIEELDRFEKLLPPHLFRRLLAGAKTGRSISANLSAPSLQALARRAGREVGTGDVEALLRPAASSSRSYSCSPNRPSCRRFMTLQERMANRRIVAAAAGGKKRSKSSHQ